MFRRWLISCAAFILLFMVPLGLAQGNKPIANQFSVRIFSSANIMGYLEPCG